MTDIQQEQLPPKKEISAEEFIKIWRGDYKGIERYKDFYQIHSIDREDLVVFNGYFIREDIIVSDAINLPTLHFANTYTSNIKFKQCNIAGLWLDEKTKVDDINIIESKVGEIFFKDVISKDFSVSFSDIEHVQIHDTGLDHISIKQSTAGVISVDDSYMDFFIVKQLSFKFNIC